jgi:hypothetical protein
MEFADSTAYKTYNDNPEHVKICKRKMGNRGFGLYGNRSGEL